MATIYESEFCHSTFFLIIPLDGENIGLRSVQREHSALLSTFIKVPFSIKTFVLSFYKWTLKTGFTRDTKLFSKLPRVFSSLLKYGNVNCLASSFYAILRFYISISLDLSKKEENFV